MKPQFIEGGSVKGTNNSRQASTLEQKSISLAFNQHRCQGRQLSSKLRTHANTANDF